MENPGKRITPYDIAELLGKAYPLAFTMKNITAGFRSTGIFPFDKNRFQDCDFSSAEVTDIPMDHHVTGEDSPPLPSTSKISGLDDSLVNNCCQTNVSNTDATLVPNTSIQTRIFCGQSTLEKQTVFPETILPYPKATKEPVKMFNKRKRKTTTILTATPEITRLEEEEKLKKIKLKPKMKAVKKDISKEMAGGYKKTKKRDLSESSDSDANVVLADSDDDVSYFEVEQPDPVILNIADVAEDSFVLVKFATKKTLKYYVGKVVEIHTGQFEVTVNFLRKHGNNYIFPTVEDQSTIDFDNIVLHLPSPVQAGGTARANSLYRFNIDLQSYNIG